MTHNYSKLIRKKLWELAGLAHERKLSSTLETLDSHYFDYNPFTQNCGRHIFYPPQTASNRK